MGDVQAAARQLEAVARQLRTAGAGGDSSLRKELLAGIRKSNAPVIPKIRASAREKLPKRGGLANKVATGKFGTRTRTTGNSVGVQIRGTNRSVKSLKALDAGHVTHPVFGNRTVWKEQSITPGFFSEPLKAARPELRRGIEKVLSDIAKRIEQGVRL